MVLDNMIDQIIEKQLTLKDFSLEGQCEKELDVDFVKISENLPRLILPPNLPSEKSNHESKYGESGKNKPENLVIKTQRGGQKS